MLPKFFRTSRKQQVSQKELPVRMKSFKFVNKSKIEVKRPNQFIRPTYPNKCVSEQIGNV